MSSTIIPKEQLTAFERWELASFDTQPTRIHQKNAGLAATLGLDKLRKQAHDEGYAQGREKGYAAGIQQAQKEATEIHTLLQDLQSALNQVDEQVAQSLLDLSLEVARKMVGETLQIKPEIMLNVISSAIGNLPHFNQNAHLIVHPDDAELIRKHMGEQLSGTGWKIVTDPQIRRGGCRAETAHSQVDATAESRWKRIVESIGQDQSWLT